MTHWKQTDPRWTNYKYDGVNTIGKYGCFITCLAMLCDKTPIEVADILRNNNLFTNGYINNSARAASLLGLAYDGTSKVQPPYTCVAETDFYDNPSTSTMEQHFIVIEANGTRLDPLGSISAVKYNLISYRLFRKETPMFTDLEVKYIKDNLNDGNEYVATNGWELVAEAIVHAKNNFKSFEKRIAELQTENATLVTENEECNKDLKNAKIELASMTTKKDELQKQLGECLAKTATPKTNFWGDLYDLLRSLFVKK